MIEGLVYLNLRRSIPLTYRKPSIFLDCCLVHTGIRCPPPKLTADAPVLNVRQPVIVNLRPTLGMKLHPPLRPHALEFRHGGIFKKPLLAQLRLDCSIRALTKAHVVLRRLPPKLPCSVNNSSATLRALKRSTSAIGPVRHVHRAVGIDASGDQCQPDADRFQKSALSCAGVTLSTPVPNSKSTLSPMIGMSFCSRGQFRWQRPHDVLADEIRVKRVFDSPPPPCRPGFLVASSRW